ncbi:MAG: hypothetical protein N2C14_18415, partial [Planctomycetales bacterium]
AFELASGFELIPPLGFIADVGHVVFGMDRDAPAERSPFMDPAWAGLSRTYEDYVLGKLYADWSFERACDAICQYKTDRDRKRALSFLLSRFQERAGFSLVRVPPSVMKTALKNPAALLERGARSLAEQGRLPLMDELYQEIVSTVRFTAEALDEGAVRELETGTAVAEFAKHVELQQIWQSASKLGEMLPKHRAPPLARRREVPTRILDEDMYPVGGYTSISTRGSIESLLHSQLAYKETEERPDLFDMKFLRDELYYYSRDENQFLRQRRSFLFALYPDLVQARFKDAGLPYQRIVLTSAALLTAVDRLTEWLSDEALEFQFLFLENDSAKKDARTLAEEEDLIRLLLKEQIDNKTVTLNRIRVKELPAHADFKARKSLCHCVAISARDRKVDVEAALLSRLRISSATPAVGLDREPLSAMDETDPWENWGAALETLLRMWI